MANNCFAGSQERRDLLKSTIQSAEAQAEADRTKSVASVKTLQGIASLKSIEHLGLDGIEQADIPKQATQLAKKTFMVHIFRPEVRDYYQVDSLWG